MISHRKGKIGSSKWSLEIKDTVFVVERVRRHHKLSKLSMRLFAKSTIFDFYSGYMIYASKFFDYFIIFS